MVPIGALGSLTTPTFGLLIDLATQLNAMTPKSNRVLGYHLKKITFIVIDELCIKRFKSLQKNLNKDEVFLQSYNVI